ncbi:MAG: hypothetical protein ABIA37_01125, partial [Candidatus Woesearchaeota archaeon]
IRRQLFHLCLGISLTLLYYFNLIDALMLFVVVVLGGFLCLLCKQIRIPILDWFLRNFEREDQRKIFPGRGTLFFFIGVLLAVKLFEKDIALAAIMILALGDSVSHVVGRYFGRIKLFSQTKMLEGTLAGVVAGFAGAVLFVPIIPAFLGSLAAMVLEAVQIELNGRAVDDNLFIPLIAGTVIYLVLLYL